MFNLNMKKSISIILVFIVLIIAGAFYLTRSMTWSSLEFVMIWVGAIIAMHVVITPLVISIVRARDQRKAAEEEAAKQQSGNISKD